MTAFEALLDAADTILMKARKLAKNQRAADCIKEAQFQLDDATTHETASRKRKTP